MRIIPIFLVLCGIALLVGGLFELNSPTYSGKEVFYAENEYIEFKEACAKEEVDIEDIQELSSSPPIVVTFSIKSSDGFPYGTKDLESTIAMLVFGSLFMVSSIIVGIMDIITDRRIKEVNSNVTRQKGLPGKDTGLSPHNSRG